MANLLDLNLEKKDWGKVKIFILESFCIGIFVAALEISSTSLFLEQFSESELPKAFIISGGLGILITSLFSFFQGRLNYLKLMNWSLASLIILTILIRLSFGYVEGKDLVYATFVVMGPFKVLAFLAFWGMASRVFSLRQGKRLFGLIDAGQVLGAIIIGFSTSLLIAALGSTVNLLYVASGGLFLALIVQTRLRVYYEDFKDNLISDRAAGVQEKRKIWRTPYVRLMAFFVVFSTLSIFFIYNNFLSTTKAQFPDPGDLANFIGFFLSTIMIFSFLFKTFVFSRLMQTYGLKVVLLVLPVVILILAVPSIIIGSFFGTEIDPSGGITIFFLFMALTQLFAQSLKYSLEIPAFKILYQPLPQGVRYDIQSRIDGSINEGAAVLSGVFLLGIGLLPFSSGLFYLYVLVGVVAIWFFGGTRLHHRYRNALEESLARGRELLGKAADSIPNFRDLFDSVLLKDKKRATLVLDLLKRTDKRVFTEKVKVMMESGGKEQQQIALEYLRNDNLLEQTHFLEKLKRENKKGGALDLDAILKFFKELESQNGKQRIAELAKSKKYEERALAVHLIASDIGQDYHRLFRDLLKDINPEVRRSAISILAEKDWPEYWPRLIENLEIPEYHSTAYSTILQIGEPILPSLEQVFYKSGFTFEMLSEIIRIFGTIGGSKSHEYLLKKISYPDNRVVKRALIALRASDFKPEEHQKGRIKAALEHTIGRSLWFEVAKNIMATDENYPLLGETIGEEAKDANDFLFLLMSILYDPESVAFVKENLESGNPESADYAIELMDLFLDEDLKGRLFPLLEDFPITTKVRLLEAFYPVGLEEPDDILFKVLDLDFNYTQRWTKGVAMHYIGKNLRSEYYDKITSYIFHPDPFFQEFATAILSEVDENKFKEVVSRMEPEKQQDLLQIGAIGRKGEKLLSFDLCLELSMNEELQDIPKHHLLEIAESFSLKKYLKGEEIEAFSYFSSFDLAYIKKGVVNIDQKKFISPVLIGDLVNNPIEKNVKGKSEDTSLIYFVEGEDLYRLIDTHPNLVRSISKLIT
jgi:MFS family permease